MGLSCFFIPSKFLTVSNLIDMITNDIVFSNGDSMVAQIFSSVMLQRQQWTESFYPNNNKSWQITAVISYIWNTFRSFACVQRGQNASDVKISSTYLHQGLIRITDYCLESASFDNENRFLSDYNSKISRSQTSVGGKANHEHCKK